MIVSPIASGVTPLTTPLTVVAQLSRLAPGVSYSFLAACSNVGDDMGPYVPPTPATITLQRPAITSLSSAAAALSTAGGDVIVVTGTQLGAGSVVTTLVMTNGRFNLTSPRPCDFTVPSTVLSCPTPVGVGSRYSVAVVVDGVPSPPFNGTTVSYSVPAIVSVVDTVGGPLTTPDTRGGQTVLLHGNSFGPASLSHVALDRVTCGPYAAIGCVVTVDHVQISCTLGSGVGAKLVWSVTVAGQTSTHATTSYAPPRISTLTVVDDSGAVAVNDTAVTDVPTLGTATLVVTGSGFGPGGPVFPVQASASSSYVTVGGAVQRLTLQAPA